jgi:hypothetical protein
MDIGTEGLTPRFNRSNNANRYFGSNVSLIMRRENPHLVYSNSLQNTDSSKYATALDREAMKDMRAELKKDGVEYAISHPQNTGNLATAIDVSPSAFASIDVQASDYSAQQSRQEYLQMMGRPAIGAGAMVPYTGKKLTVAKRKPQVKRAVKSRFS